MSSDVQQRRQRWAKRWRRRPKRRSSNEWNGSSRRTSNRNWPNQRWEEHYRRTGTSEWRNDDRTDERNPKWERFHRTGQTVNPTDKERTSTNGFQRHIEHRTSTYNWQINPKHSHRHLFIRSSLSLHLHSSWNWFVLEVTLFHSMLEQPELDWSFVRVSSSSFPEQLHREEHKGRRRYSLTRTICDWMGP